MALIEWKPVEGSYGSFADAGSNALKAGALGVANILSAFQTGADLARRIDTNNLMRNLALAYDPKNLQSYNDALKLGAATYSSVDPETWQLLNGTYRTQQNAQLNAENLLLNQMAAAPYQNEVNKAIANGEINKAIAANNALSRLNGTDGKPIRSDAIVFGNVDPLRNSAAQRAKWAADAQATRAKMQKEQEEQYATDYVTGGTDFVLSRIDPATLADPTGQKVVWDLINTFDKQVPQDARGKTAGSKYAIFDRVNALGSTLAQRGINTSLGNTGDNPFTYRTYNTLTGDYVTNSYTIDPSQSYIAQRIAESQKQAEEQAVQRETAIKQFEKEQAKAEQERVLRDANYRTLSKEISTKGGQALNSQENKDLLKTLSPEQQQLITLEIQQQAKQALLDKQIREAKQERADIATLSMPSTSGINYPNILITAGAFGSSSLLTNEIKELQRQKEELDRQIRANQDAQVTNQAVDEVNRLIAARGYDPKSVQALSNASAVQNREAVNYQSDAIKAIGDRLDRDGRQVGVRNRTYGLIEAMSLREGYDTAYFRDRNSLKKSDGTTFKDEELIRASPTEVANAIVQMFTTPDKEVQLSDNEINRIFVNAGKYLRDYEDAFIQSGKFRGKPEDIKLAAIYLTADDILAGTERNTGLVGYFGDIFDFLEKDADRAHNDFLKALKGEDEVINTHINQIRNLNVSQSLIDQAIFSSTESATKLDNLTKKIAREGGTPSDTEAKLMWQYAKDMATQGNIATKLLNDPLYRGSSTQGR